MLQKFGWTSVKIVLLQYNSNFSYSSGLYVQNRYTEKSFKTAVYYKSELLRAIVEKIFLIKNSVIIQSLSQATNAYRKKFMLF
jgi:hypothetical protein